MFRYLKQPMWYVTVTVLPAVLVLAGFAWGLRRPERELVVWSCGGNYESLKEYMASFEKDTGVRVRYTAAPVMYLLEAAISDPNPPDVIVGRAGPGWIALAKAEKLLAGPEFFAIDPLVLAVPKGNPKGIRGVVDLGRPGVRIAQASDAMRPKGKVPALFMAAVSDSRYPGLVERWDANTTVHVSCGRKLLDPLASGQADAAVAPRSLLSYPAYRGVFEEVPIPADLLLSMKAGRPSMPQCAGVLTAAAERGKDRLARQFVAGLSGSPDWLGRHGYLSLDEERAVALRSLLEVSSPKDMPGLQCYLAELLTRYGLEGEARRRYLKVLYTFGPNRYTARALCRTAHLSLTNGNAAAARLDWQRLLDDYPPKQPVEYDSPVLHAGGKPAPVSRRSYDEWRRAAADGLASLRQGSARSARLTLLDDPVVRRQFPVEMKESDAPKNGKREFGLGLHLAVIGDAEFATRDLLKVVTLRHGSPFMADAEYVLGLCARERGMPQLARRQWERVIELYPDSAAGEAARRQQARGPQQDAGGTSPGRSRPPMPPWEEAYDTHADRAMVYGMRLYEHGLPLFAFKEMMKIASGIYGTHHVEAELRYRAGIACEALGNGSAADLQWSLCAAAADGPAWARLARRKLESRDSPAVLATGTSPRGLGATGPPPSGPARRFHLAEEFRRAGVHEDGQVILEYLKVLTVARPPLTPKTEPMLAAAQYHLSTCLARSGRHKDAAGVLTALATKHPDSPWAARARQSLLDQTPPRRDDSAADDSGRGQ